MRPLQADSVKWSSRIPWFVAILAVQCACVSAQDRTPGSKRCSEGPSEGGSIRGVLLLPGDTTAKATVMVQQDSMRFWCSVTPDVNGTFELLGIPPGRYALTLGSWSLERIPPIEVSIGRDSVVRLTIPVRKADYVAECMRQPRCASVLTRATTAELDPESADPSGVAGYRLAIAMSMRAWPKGSEMVVCVPPQFVQALAEVYPAVSSRADCSWPEPRKTGTRLRHTPSGREAVGVEVSAQESIAEDRRRLTFAYHAAGLWAGGFECTIERVTGVWTPIACRGTWIS